MKIEGIKDKQGKNFSKVKDTSQNKFHVTTYGAVAKATELPDGTTSNIIEKGQLTTGGLLMTMSTGVNAVLRTSATSSDMEDVLPKEYKATFESVEKTTTKLLEPHFADTFQESPESNVPKHPTLNLLVCPRFQEGRCELQTCPYAHPGVRDSARLRPLSPNNVGDENGSHGKRNKWPRIYRGRRKGRVRNAYDQQKFCVTICLEALTNSVCIKDKGCDCYHPYVRQLSAKTAKVLYPKRNELRQNFFPNGTLIDGCIMNGIHQTFGVLQWGNGDVYVGACHGSSRHGYGMVSSRFSHVISFVSSPILSRKNGL